LALRPPGGRIAALWKHP